MLSDLRMGVECSYVFNFAVGEKTESGVQVGDFEKVSQIGRIWDRIWDPSVSLVPALAASECE